MVQEDARAGWKIVAIYICVLIIVVVCVICITSLFKDGKSISQYAEKLE